MKVGLHATADIRRLVHRKFVTAVMASDTSVGVMLAEISHSARPNRADDLSFAAVRSLMARYRGRLTFVTVLRVISSVLPALHPYFIAQLATSIDEPDRAGRFLALLFFTGFAHFVLWTICDYYVAAKINPLTYEFKRLAFDTVWSEDYQQFVDRPSGKVASYVNDLRKHSLVLWDSAHYGFLPVLSAVPVYIVLLWQTSAGNALVYGLFLILAGFALAAIGRPVNARQRHLTNITSDNTGRVFDSFSNFVNVFSFRAHRREIARNDTQIDGLIDQDIRATYALATYWGAASLMIRGLLWAAVIGFSWYQFDRGAIGFTAMVISVTVLLDFTNQYWAVVHHIGEWIDKSAAFREAYTYLFPGRNIVTDPARLALAARPEDAGLIAASAPASVSASSAALATVAGATAAAKAATNSRSTTAGSAGSSASPSAPGTKPARAAPTALRLTDRIEVRNLRFAYPDEPDRLVLEDVSFTVRRGERLGVVGRSGEGKSTLVKILLGFYAPTSGEVLVDGRAVGPEELATLQSYVPQDTSLFQETIEYNIGYAEPGPADPARIRVAADKANIGSFIESLPDGYQTYVGERGIKLSLGQRQRIAIARAFLKEADLVILDEATSALDSETEAKIQESLIELWEKRAAIVIAHRLATLNDVDRILVIEHGKVVEEGAKEDLLAAPGRFAEMWGLQRAGLH